MERVVLFDELKGLSAVTRSCHIVAGRTEHRSDDVSVKVIVIVIDDKDAGSRDPSRCCWHKRSPLPGVSGEA